MALAQQFDPWAAYRGPRGVVWPRKMYSVRRRARRRLGALDPTAAADQIFPQSAVIKKVGFDQRERDGILRSAQSGQIYVEPGWDSYCGGSSSGKGAALALSASGGMAIKFAAATGPAAPFVAIAGGVMQFFGAIFGHHAQVYAREKSVVCAAVPAANDTLNVIDQGVKSGQISPQDAIAALAQLQQQFSAQVSAIVKDDSSHCNSSCSYKRELAAVCAVRASEYQDMVTAQSQAAAAPVSSAVASAAGKLGLPAWALWAFGGFLVFESLTD